MKWLSVLLLSAAAFGQGTTVPGPLTVTVPTGTSPTSVLRLTQATTEFPCVYAGMSDFEICGQDGQVTVNFGQGWISLKGDKGDPGEAGVQGTQGIPGVSITGPAGPAGPPGAPGQGISWPITITCATATAAKGGHGVPQFSVTQMRLFNCSLSK